MKPLWNPTIKTLVKNLEFIEKNSPCPMNSIPMSKMSFHWYFNFKDNGWLDVTRSEDDGRSHLVRLTAEGKKLLETLKLIKDADQIMCHRCGEPIDHFFRVPNAEWKRVTGNAHDQVICKSCFDKIKRKI
jgi:hypothetical protein